MIFLLLSTLHREWVGTHGKYSSWDNAFITFHLDSFYSVILGSGTDPV